MSAHKCHQETKIALNEQMMNQIDKRLTNIETKLDAFIDRADNRYASKTTEKIVYSLVGIICIAFITALVALVWK